MSAVKYIAQLGGVRELALHGAADLSWWREQLVGEGLEPVEVDGAAQVVLTGLDARWLLWPFRDLSVSVVARRSGSEEAGLLLARAFNASRLIVFFESRWFKLPYSRRAVHVEVGDSGSMRLGEGDVLAEMAPRTPGGEPAEMSYTGPLYLPGRRWLMVDIRGLTSTFEFDGACDRFEIARECVDPILAGLRASRFRGIRWHVRRDATHARSKTFRVRG